MKLRIFFLLGLLFIWGSIPSFAQKQLKYVPEVVSGTVEKTAKKAAEVPSLINPNLPLATRQRLADLSGVVVNRTVVNSTVPTRTADTGVLATSAPGVRTSVVSGIVADNPVEIPGPRAAQRTPEEIYDATVKFIQENNRYPSKTAQDPIERSLRFASDNMIARAKYPNDPTIVRAKALKERWVKKHTADRTPLQILEQIQQYQAEHNGEIPKRTNADQEISSLRTAWDAVYQTYKDVPPEQIANETVGKLVALHREKVRERTAPRSAQEILDQIKQYRLENDGNIPSKRSVQKEETSLRTAWDAVYQTYRDVPPEQIADAAVRDLVVLHRELLPTLPSAPVNPADNLAIPETGTDLTGVQVLQHYFPTWRQEFGGMFSREQLDVIEQTFQATDDWMFVRGEGGTLQARNADEWDYESRFLTFLQNNAVSFTQAQVKRLVGGTGIKGFTLLPVFTFASTELCIKTTGFFPNGKDRQALYRKTGIVIKTQPVLGKHMSALKEEYAQRLKPSQTLERLKDYMARHDGKFPPEVKQDAEAYAIAVSVRNTIKYAEQTDNTQDPVIAEMIRLRDEGRTREVSRSNPQLLQEIKAWMAEHDGEYPHKISENSYEAYLYKAVNDHLYVARQNGTLETDEALQELEQIKKDNYRHTPGRSAQQVLQEVRQYMASHQGEYPSSYYEKDPRAALLSGAVHNAIRWARVNGTSHTNPTIAELERLRAENRKIAERKSPQELYQDFLLYLQNYRRYPLGSSYLYQALRSRLNYYRSTMVDGKYADPWLQKIHDLKTAIQNAPDGKFTITPDGQGGYTLEIEQPVEPFPEVAQPAEGITPVGPAPHVLRRKIDEQTKNLIEALRDQAALERREFSPWIRSMHEPENFPQIVDSNTFTALHTLSKAINFDYRNHQQRRAVTYLLETVNNYVGILGEQNDSFYKLIYRGQADPNILPSADGFHAISEVQGIESQAPEITKLKRLYAMAKEQNTPYNVYLDEENGTVWGIKFNRNTDIETLKTDLETTVKYLTPPGYTVRMGLHEVGISGNDYTKFRKGFVHIHLEEIATEADEAGGFTDISVSLDIKASRFAGWWNRNTQEFEHFWDKQIAQNYLRLFDSFLNKEAKAKLKEIAGE